MIKAFDPKILWDDYGIVDCIVSTAPCYHQAALTDVKLQPFTHYFPRADIHELISPDILHQIITGGFKDHLVSWVEEYLNITHGKAAAKRHMTDIDRRYDFVLLLSFLFINSLETA
jgi:hypothetical protein